MTTTTRIDLKAGRKVYPRVSDSERGGVVKAFFLGILYSAAWAIGLTFGLFDVAVWEHWLIAVLGHVAGVFAVYFVLLGNAFYR